MSVSNNVVIIELDRPRELKFTHSALRTFSELTGKAMEDIDKEGLDTSSFDTIEKMAYCALLKDARKEGETLSLDTISELLDEAPSWAELTTKLVTAWCIAVGAPVPDFTTLEGNANPNLQSEDQEKEKASTGTKASDKQSAAV